MISDPVDKVELVECHLEWADGREYWSENPEEIARAVYYRRRVRGGRGMPYAVTCWREGPGSRNTVLWEMEWTEEDLRPTPADVANMIRQGVPPRFIYDLFPNRDTLALLREWSDDPALPKPVDPVKERRKRYARRCATPVQ